MSLFVSLKICREVDNFVLALAAACPSNKNVELGGRDGFKLFHYGLTSYIRGKRRIDGGWHIAIARHLHLFLCTSDLMTLPQKKKLGRAYHLLFQVQLVLSTVDKLNFVPCTRMPHFITLYITNVTFCTSILTFHYVYIRLKLICCFRYTPPCACRFAS